MLSYFASVTDWYVPITVALNHDNDGAPSRKSAGRRHAASARNGLATLGLTGKETRNAALFFPRVIQADPNRVDRSIPSRPAA